MISFIAGIILACLLFFTISLKKTYHHVSLKELKRQAKTGDELSALLYRVAAYGTGLDLFLWIVIGLLSSVFFVLLGHNFPIIIAFFGCVAAVWFGFAWLPGSHVSKPGVLAAKASARPLAWVLEWLHRPLQWLSRHIAKARPIHAHSGLYTKDDLLELLDQQKNQIDNRIHKRDLALAAKALLMNDQSVADVMVPMQKVKTIATHDMVGPVLLDELHKSGQTHFPVYQGGDKKDIVGILNITDAFETAEGGFVKDLMTTRLYYLHEEEKVAEAFLTLAQTKHPLFLVINDHEDVTGILSLEELLGELIHELPHSEFNSHGNKSAVATKKQHTNEPQVEADMVINDDGEIVDSDEPVAKEEPKPQEDRSKKVGYTHESNENTE